MVIVSLYYSFLVPIQQLVQAGLNVNIDREVNKMEQIENVIMHHVKCNTKACQFCQ